MKALARYRPNVAYTTIVEDTAHIIVPLEVNPLTQGFAPPFHDLIDTTRATSVTEDGLVLAVARAEGFVYAVDADLDALALIILHAVLASVGGNKEHPFYLFFVGDQTPGQIVDPVLDSELATVKNWVGPLQSSADPTLQAHGAALESKITEAVQRVSELTAAEQALKQFKELGGRKLLVDSANALRSSTQGALNQLVDTQPGSNLTVDAVERVFRYERMRRRRRPPPTSKEVAKRIAANEEEHVTLVALLAAMEASEAAAEGAKKKAKAKPTAEALAAAKKKADELAKEIAELEAKLTTP